MFNGKRIGLALAITCIGVSLLCGCGHGKSSAATPQSTAAGESKKTETKTAGKKDKKKTEDQTAESTTQVSYPEEGTTDMWGNVDETTTAPEEATTEPALKAVEKIKYDISWEYAEYSKIHTSKAILFRSVEDPDIRKDITICVNAGHGTKGGESVMTQCHPDGSPKVTGGSTSSGATKATAVSSGMTFNDGTSEADANLALALILKDRLLEEGYDVLMIRRKEDVQLDNIARTVMANNNADCHIAIHYDSTESDKGVFFLSVPDNSSYKSMEPVRSHWKEHNALGRALVKGIEKEGFSLFSGGELPTDLTQTSYSTVPSVDLEVGDAASDHSQSTQEGLAEGVVNGLNEYFDQ